MIKLWKHQEEAIERAKLVPNFALFFQPGCGKTATAIHIIRGKFNAQKRHMRTLIFAPPIVLLNWKREFGIHSKVPQDKIHILNGTEKQRVKIFKEESQGIFITNYEALLMKTLYREFLLWNPEILVCDESHKLKSPQSKRTKQAVTLAQDTKHTYLLTGTPVLNSPMDLFSQFLVMDKGETFGHNFFRFRAIYCEDKNALMPRQKYFPNWQLRPGALEAIGQAIAYTSMHVKKSECLDLPPLVKKVIEVELSPEQKKHYLEMKNDFITYVKDKACVATLAITKALRLQQIVSGHMPIVGVDPSDEDRDSTQGPPNKGVSTMHFGASPRIAALEELLEELTPHHKVIVWAVFKENYEQIRHLCTKLSITSTEVHGGISNEQKFRNVDDFNNNPNIRVLIGHPGSGGIGINLVAASYAIFFSRNFSLEQDLQAEARNYRGGSEIHASVTRIDLVASNTIDEIIMKKLASKQNIGETVLKELCDEL